MRMQLAFRATSHKIGERQVSMVAGFVSAMPGQLPAEGIAEMGVLDGTPEGITELGPIRHIYFPSREHDPNYLSYGMGSFVTQRFWDIPARGQVLQLYCREVRMPSDHLLGQVYAVESLIALSEKMAPAYDLISVFAQHREGFSMSGALGREIHPDWDIPPLVEATRGNSLAAFFRMPLWGFGDEPVGLVATMHPKVCDAYDRYRWGPETDRKPELVALIRDAGLDWPKQTDYLTAISSIRGKYPGFLENRSSAGVQTKADDLLMSQRFREAIEQLELARDAEGIGLAP